MKLPADFKLPPGTTFGPPAALPGAEPAKAGTRRVVTLVEAAVTVLEFTAPVVVKSEPNLRCHWSARHKRFKAQALELSNYLCMLGWRFSQIALPVVVTLTKLGGRKMDSHENLPAAFKGVVDYLSRGLGVDDGDESAVEWRYDQRPGAGPVGIRVRVESREG